MEAIVWRLLRKAPEDRFQTAADLVWALEQPSTHSVRARARMEPSSAVPLATILKNRDDFKGKRVGVIITGGNVDLDKLPWMQG